ncbi:hypothetical protein L6164_030699 [Bauhinia variegata]|uniref:Uncharacterized protein n=1 Tax=Bauhinia variegata TaxID=167791 RepID=A0ACB9LDH8_BAUVA|nr:hypothetical protein L6164_030699 [Bauhinia variegata]
MLSVLFLGNITISLHSRIPPNQAAREDKIFWVGSADGLFLVKSAYNALLGRDKDREDRFGISDLEVEGSRTYQIVSLEGEA